MSKAQASKMSTITHISMFSASALMIVEFIEFEFLYTYISMYRQLHRYHLPGQLTELPVTVQLLCP